MAVTKVDIGVLGRLVVTSDGRPIPVSTGATSIVLSILVVESRAVPAAELASVIEAISGRPVSLATVHTAVWRLRQRLGESAIVATDGYRLDPASVTTDVAAFEASLLAGCLHRDTGDYAAAATAFGEAVGLWRGPALDQLAGSSLGASHGARLGDLRAGATEEWGAVLLASGSAACAARVLEPLVRDHGSRERAWATLVKAYQEAGRPDDARSTFDRARLELAEHGLEPGAQLRAAAEGLRHRGRPSDGAGPGLPTLAALAARAPLVGRQQELARVMTATAPSLAGQRLSMVFVAGGPGLGKTRLAAEVAVLAHRSGARVWFEMADAGTAGPMAPMDDWARQAVADLSADRARHFSEGPLGEMVSFASPPDAAPERRRWAMYRALTDLVVEACGGPSLLVLDDLHAASVDTVRFLHHLAVVRPDLPLAVVATYRPGGMDEARFEAMARLQRVPNAIDHICLPELGESETAALFAALRDPDGPDRFLPERVYRATGGHPGLVSVVASRPEILLAGDEAWGGATTGPVLERAVHNLVGHPVPAARRLLEVMAVAALVRPTVGAQLVAATGSLLEDSSALDLLGGAQACVDAGLVAEVAWGEPHWLFKHELVRDFVYRRIPLERRSHLHLTVARALTQIGDPGEGGGPVEVVAGHYQRAWPIWPAPGIGAALRSSALRAMERLSFPRAADLLTEALGVLFAQRDATPDRTQGELLLLLGWARAGAGDSTGAARACQEAARLAEHYGWDDIEAAAPIICLALPSNGSAAHRPELAFLMGAGATE